MLNQYTNLLSLQLQDQETGMAGGEEEGACPRAREWAAEVVGGRAQARELSFEEAASGGQDEACPA